MNEVKTEPSEVPEAPDTEAPEEQEATAPPAGEEPAAPAEEEEEKSEEEEVKPTTAPSTEEELEPTVAPSDEVMEETEAPPAGEEDTEGSGSLEKEKPVVPEEPSSIQEAELDEIPGADQTCADEAAPLENMPIPSVIIEPASSNEGDDDRDGDIISPTAASDNDVTTVSQTMKHMSPSGGVSGLPDDFLYKVTSAFNGLSQDAAPPSFFADFDQMNEVKTEPSEVPEAPDTEAPEEQEATAPPAGEEPAAPAEEEEEKSEEEEVKPTTAPSTEEELEPTVAPSDEVMEETEAPPAGEEDTEGSGSLEKEKPVVPEEPSSIQEAELDEIPGADQTCADEAAPLENMPIPSVIIEPASSNEGDDDRDGDIISPTAASDNDVTTVSQTMKHMSPSGGVSGLPDDFLYKVETMHDFEAANSDELELKRGDVVLVVPTESAEDQDAGWLTGIKESEWLARGASAQKGLFPENFTQRLE
ncbi:amphiphysin-like isoform X2 [Takifugu flavidus]|uniref:amphiphysin-like isoform X2 n=1 Tax=Takifugu flavidus TaxID=433684 RepID=UPI002544697C|nr:amphiphysin-like isoform X2 [Takifugu flavidus]